MFSKFFKSGLSLLIASVLILTPQNTIFAANTTASESQLSTVSTETPDSVANAAKKRADALTKLYGVTSIQYALISDGTIEFTGTSGYDNKEKELAPTDTTMYGIGSVSKIFTTLAVLKLSEEGLVNLDTPVVTYLPEFKMADSRYKDITVRMLLNHSSGLMGSTLDNCLLLGEADTTTHDNFLKLLRKQRLKADPGAFSVYCNDGFTLAELVIEKVSGKSFGQFIADNFTKPLNMTHTKTPSDDFKTSNLAGIYSNTGNKLPYETLCAYGAGGIFSTATDLCKLSTVIMNETDLLSSESVNSMEQEEYKNGQWHPENDSVLSYGLGWDSVNTYPFTDYNISALVKGGDSLYYHCGLTVLPDENMAVAVLSSGGSSTYNEIFAQSILLDALKENGRISSIHEKKTFDKPVKTTVPDDLLSYSGFYGNFSGVAKLEVNKEGTLTIYNSPSAKVDYIYTGNNRFYSPDGSTYLSFIEQNGNTYLYQSAYFTLPSLGDSALSLYNAQKLEPNELPETISESWTPYLNKNFYLVSEKYSSALYVQTLEKTQLETIDGLPNYISSYPITDRASAKTNLQIPAMHGRDLNDIQLRDIGNKKYIAAGNRVFISEENINNLSTKKNFTVSIPKNGHAKYYKIGKKSVNKTIKIDLPKKSSVTVYDKDGITLYSSYVSGKNSVTLPKNGMIVFVGSKNATFNVAYDSSSK